MKFMCKLRVSGAPEILLVPDPSAIDVHNDIATTVVYDFLQRHLMVLATLFICLLPRQLLREWWRQPYNDNTFEV